MAYSGIAGSGLKGFPKQWCLLAICSLKERAILGGSRGMLPQKILQTFVLKKKKGNSDHFSTTDNKWVSFSSLDFYIKTCWHSDEIWWKPSSKRNKKKSFVAVQPKIVIYLWGWAKESLIKIYNDWSCMSVEKIEMLQKTSMSSGVGYPCTATQ